MPGIIGKAPPYYNKTLSRIFFFSPIFIFSAAGHTPSIPFSLARGCLFVSLRPIRRRRHGILAINSRKAKRGSASCPIWPAPRAKMDSAPLLNCIRLCRACTKLRTVRRAGDTGTPTPRKANRRCARYETLSRMSRTICDWQSAAVACAA